MMRAFFVGAPDVLSAAIVVECNNTFYRNQRRDSRRWRTAMKYFLCYPILFALFLGLPVGAGTDWPGLDDVRRNNPLLNFETPVDVWDEALPLGNGTLGALVWGDGRPLRISLDRTDLWDLRPVPEYHSDQYDYQLMQQWEKEGRVDDLKQLYENPYHRPAPTKIPAGRIELGLPDGTIFEAIRLNALPPAAQIELGKIRARVWVHATEPVGLIDVEGTVPTSVRLQAPAFGGKEEGPNEAAIVMGELSELGYPPPTESHGDTWQAYTQEGWGGFAFSVYLGWTPTPTGWRGAWSIASNRDGGDPLAKAMAQVEGALSERAKALAQSHAVWWEAYWRKSLVRVPDARLERQWYLDIYKFGAATRKGAPPITLQGPWTADNGKIPPWKGDYHHDLNTELSYWPAYSGNRLEEGENFVNWLWETRAACRNWTKRFFGLPGLAVPMTADLNNNQIGGWRQYTHSATTGCWLAHHFYLHYQFGQDEAFLRTRAYPYLRECAVFVEAVTAEKDEQGKRTLPLSSSPEINDNRPEAWFEGITNYDLALMRWLLGATAELAEKAGQPEDSARWKGVLAELPAWSLAEDGALLVAPDYPLPFSHRHFSHLMAIHPLGLIDGEHGAAAERTIAASLAELERFGTKAWTGYSFSWLASMAARAHDGDKAARALDTFAEAFVLRNSFHCNGDQSGKGYSNLTYRPFTLEGNFAYASGLQEMLLQSHAGAIEVFPAIPASWKSVAFSTLRAQDAYLVSARRSAAGDQRVRIVAEKPGACRFRSWVTDEVLEYAMEAGGILELVSASGDGEVHVVAGG
jgi:alpha-L-fucosidase 2